MLAEENMWGLIDYFLVGALWVMALALTLTADVSGPLSWVARRLNLPGLPILEVSHLTFFPLRINDMRAAIALPRLGISVIVSFSHLAVYSRGAALYADEHDKLLNVRIDDFVLLIEGVSFEDICGVSQKKLNEAKKKIVYTAAMIENSYWACLAASLVRMHCTNIDFTFVLADPKGLVIHLQSLDLNCMAEWNDRGGRVIDCRIRAACGQVAVHSGPTMVANVWTDQFDLLVQLLSKKLHMSVEVTFGEQIFADVSIQPFLVLFGQFQSAEDDAIEVKELHGMSPAGKMKLMAVRMPHGASVCLTDSRLPVPLVLRLGAVSASLSSDKQLFDDSKIVKTIAATIQSVAFVGLHGSVNGVQAEIVKTVNNCGSYLDHEDMTVSVDDVDVRFVQPLLLAWLCALQDTSNKLPSSRFAHPKSSAMIASINNFYLSVMSSALSDSPVAMDPISGGWMESCMQQPESVEEFLFEKMMVTKQQAAGTNLGFFEITLFTLKVTNKYLSTNLMQKYNIYLDLPVRGYTNQCGVIFNFIGVILRFELAENLDIKMFAAEVFTLNHILETGQYKCHMSISEEKVMNPGAYLACVGLDVSCPKAEQFDIKLGSLKGTFGVLTYLRFSYGLAELRGFISKAVDVLAGIKTGNNIPLLYNPRFLHTVADVSNLSAWAPFPPPRTLPIPPPKPADAYMKVSMITAEINLIVRTGVDNLKDIECPNDCRVSMDIKMDTFLYLTSAEAKTVISWTSLDVFSNRWLQAAFLSFRRTLITLTDSPDSSSTVLESDCFTITMHAKMCLGKLIEASMHQRDIFRLATAGPVNSGHSSMATKNHSEPSSVEASVAVVSDSARSKRKKKLLAIKFKEAFRIFLDCTFDKQEVPKFLVIEWLEQSIIIKSTEDVEHDERRVRELDGEPANSHNHHLRYGGFIGGDLSMTCSNFQVSVAPEISKYIYATDVSYTGVFYLATVIDPRIELISRLILVSDDLHDFQPRFFCELVNPTAPSKVYTNWTHSYGSLEVHLHPKMPMYLEAISNVITATLPPNDDPTPPMLWWDSYRYWLQGTTTMKVELFKIVHTTIGAARSTLNLLLLMKKAKINVVKGMVEFLSNDFSINAEIFENASRSRMRNNRILQKSQAMRSQLFVIPRFSMSLVHNRKITANKMDSVHSILSNRLRKGVYSHHDVYLYPSQVTPIDKFAHFRTRKWSVDWALHVHCARSSHQRGIVSLYARLDVLLRVLDIFQRPSTALAKEKPNGLPESQSDDIQSGGLKEKTTLSLCEPDVLWIFDVLSSLNLFVSFDKLLACSWPSEHNLEGVVVTQDSLVLQMKQFREVDDATFKTKYTAALAEIAAAIDAGDLPVDLPSNSLQIESLKIDVEKLEVYVRDWSGPSQVSRKKRPMLHSNVSDLLEQFESIPSLNGLFGAICKLFHASKLSVSLLSEADVSKIGINDGKGHTRRASITPHLLLAHQHLGVRVLPSWMHPWDEYWWGIKDIKKTAQAPLFFASLKQPVSRNSYVRYRFLMAEFQHYGRNNHKVKSNINAETRVVPANTRKRQQSERLFQPLKGFRVSPTSRIIQPSISVPQRPSKDRCMGIADFAGNHALAHPPPSSLPTSYFYSSLPVHAVDLAAPRPRHSKQFKVVTAQTSAKDKLDASLKIWGLSIVDMRLLWSISLRNALFGYIAHYYEILKYQKTVNSNQAGQNEPEEKKKSADRRRSKTSDQDVKDGMHNEPIIKRKKSMPESAALELTEAVDSKATDVIDAPGDALPRSAIPMSADNAEPQSILSNLFLSPGSNLKKREIDRKSNHRSSNSKRLSRPSVESDSNIDTKAEPEAEVINMPRAENHISPYSRPSISSRRMSLLFRDIQQHSFDTPRSGISPLHHASEETNSTNGDLALKSPSIDAGNNVPFLKNKSPLQQRRLLEDWKSSDQAVANESEINTWDSKSELISMFHSSYPSQESLAETYLTPQIQSDRSESRKGSNLKQFKDSPRSTSCSSQPSTVATRGDSAKFKDDRGRASSIEMLFNRESFAMPADLLEEGGASNRSITSSVTPFSEVSAAHTYVEPNRREGVDRDEIRAEPSHKRYFIVELIDPQVNFLDEKTQSSLLIVAGKSSMEGEKGTVAYSSDTRSEAPKRENTLKLHMDAVSAYTVSASLQKDAYSENKAFFNGENSVENVIFWKTMDCTEILPNNTVAMSLQKLSHRGSFVAATDGAAERYVRSEQSYLRLQKYDFEGVAIGPSGREMRANNLLLAIADFQIKALYTFHEDVNLEEEKMAVLASKKELVSLFMLDLPDVCVDITSAQFYIVLNVVTNLLLAPPPKTESSWQKDEAEEPGDVKKKNIRILTVAEKVPHLPGEVTAIASTEANVIPHALIDLDISVRKDREDMQRVLDGLSASVLAQHGPEEFGLSRHVEYLLGRGVWILRTDGDSKCPSTSSSDVEIGFMGLFGAHTFHDDRGSTSLIEVQRFWVGKDLHKLSAVADGNEKGTAGAVTTAAAAVGSADIIAPRLHSADPCTRCGRLFEVRRNTSTSCQMHMDSDGKLGTYLRYRVVSAPRIKYINKWSCCGQQDELAPGCSKRAHLCKEVMVSVRAEANPTVIVDNLEVTVFNALEISVFPGAQYEICVEITRQLVDILHTYFSIKEDDEIYAGKIEKVDEANVQQSSVDEGSGKKSAYQQSSALYIKYLRVGEINVEVSTVGFPVNLKRYNAIVAPFIKHGRILDWPRLIWMIEKHAIWSVTKHTATSGISQVWKSIFTSSAALPVRLGAVLETGPSEGVQSVNENNFWGDDNDEGARRGSEFLGIRQNKAALH